MVLRTLWMVTCVLRTQIHLLVFLVGGQFIGHPTPQHYIRSCSLHSCIGRFFGSATHYLLHRTVPPPQQRAVRVKILPHVPAMPLGLVLEIDQLGNAHLVTQLSFFSKMKPSKELFTIVAVSAQLYMKPQKFVFTTGILALFPFCSQILLEIFILQHRKD